MTILIVEDDAFKLNAIRAALSDVVETEVEVATSLRAAMTSLEARIFDFVVLDMAIPSHTSDAGAVDTYSQPVGGLDVLLFLAANGRADRVAILTQHPTVEYDRQHVPLRDLNRTLKEDGITNVVEVILFTESGEWKSPLLSTIAARQ